MIFIANVSVIGISINLLISTRLVVECLSHVVYTMTALFTVSVVTTLSAVYPCSPVCLSCTSLKNSQSQSMLQLRFQ